MTLSVKALIQNRKRSSTEKQCLGSATIYNAAGQPIGQKGSYKMWRRTPYRMNTYFFKQVIDTHLKETGSTKTQLTLFGEQIQQELGESVKLSKDGNFVAVSSPNYETAQWTDGGKVDVYWRSGSTWVLKDTLEGQGFQEQLGSEISLSGNGNVLVSSNVKSNSTQPGIVRTLIVSTGNNYPALDMNNNNSFGSSLALNFDGSVLVVGVSSIPEVNIYKNDFTNNKWNLHKTIQSPNYQSTSNFGISVAIAEEYQNGHIIAVGETSSIGQVRVYKFTNDLYSYSLIGIVDDPYNNIYSKFGAFIALSGDASVLAISAPLASSPSSLTNAGFVYLIKRDTSASAQEQYTNTNQLGNIIYGESADTYCGSSIRLRQQGSLLGVGCLKDGPLASTNNGHGAIYKLENNIWKQQYSNIYGELGKSTNYALSDFDIDDSGTTFALGRQYAFFTNTDEGSLEILKLNIKAVQTTDYHRVIPRDSLACGEDCWNRSNNSKNCYLNGSTQEYIKDTCANSKTLQKCGLSVTTTGTAGRKLNIGTARNSGLVLPRTARAFMLQPKCPLKSGLTLRGPNSVQNTQQLLQQQGIDYARGRRCNEPGINVPILANIPVALSEETEKKQKEALMTKTSSPLLRLGAMSNSTYVNHQRVMARRNKCEAPGTIY